MRSCYLHAGRAGLCVLEACPEAGAGPSEEWTVVVHMHSGGSVCMCVIKKKEWPWGGVGRPAE